MIYKLITTIEVNEANGTVNIIKTEKVRIDETDEIDEIDESSDNMDGKQIINGSHILRRSEPQYGIFIFSMQETSELYKALPLDSDIFVMFKGKKYKAHTHSSKSGRINRLSSFYRDAKLEQNDTIQVAYNTETNILEIIKK